jgi:peptide/nickel transport system substrate-binding protein
MGKAKTGLRTVVLVGVGALLLAACGGGDSGGSGGSGDTSGGTKGGTLRFLNLETQFLHLDPQRNYTGEDLAFASGYMQRTLVSYTYVEGADGWALVPDLATDTGRPNEDGSSWEFTLKDGVTFEDGTAIDCASVKYGVSRTFAQSVITDGPSYAVSLLDVQDYKGPYDTSAKNNVAGFDAAVQCSEDGKTITFNLARPAPDFNATTTLLAFSPVPEAVDQNPKTGGENYDKRPVSSGPYKIETYDKGNELVLVRNDAWDESTDDIRPAYPDQIVVEFGVDPAVIDQRIIASSGDDADALPIGNLQPENLSTVWPSGPGSDPDPQFDGRAFNELDPYVRYLAINTVSVPNLQHRQAILAALDREAQRIIAGGDFSGDLADGVIKSNFLGYEPTGLWDPGLLGAAVPDTGDPELAKQLIADSGEPMPTLTYDYATTPTNDKAAASVVESLGRAGIKVTPNPIDPAQYYGVVLNPARAGDIMVAGWGPDWSNASTIIPELFTPSGGFNLSQVSEKAFPDFVQGVDDAKAILDFNEQAQAWNDLNAQAMEQGFAVPTRFGREQRLAGSSVGGAYIWAPYGSWPYATLWVNQ